MIGFRRNERSISSECALRPTTSGRIHARCSRAHSRPTAAAVSSSRVRSASSTTALKLSPRRRNSLATVSSISRWSATGRRRSRDVNSFGVEVMLVQRSLQPPPLPAGRVEGGHVVLALARHLETRVFEGGNDIGAALHDAVLDALHQVVPDQLARVGFVLQAGPQMRRLDVGAMAGLLRPRPRRVVRPDPACSWLKASRSGS